jgi:putative tryptophan/tyrosine transport system substrate-binding protein
LISYGVEVPENYRRTGYFVDKILKGNNPAELPIEFPTKLRLAINLKAAKAIDLAVPETLLATADEVIQ